MTTELPKFYTKDATLQFANNEEVKGLDNIIGVSSSFHLGEYEILTMLVIDVQWYLSSIKHYEA